VLRFARIERGTLATQPYEWAFIDQLFSPEDAAELSADFPRDNFKTVRGHDREKGYAYEARALVHMGADAPAHVAGLSPAWRRLAEDLLSSEYRRALTRLLGRELGSLPMEVNVFRYPPRAWLGPHVDLKDKLITHVFYFNDVWDEGQGGCLNVLRSPDMTDAAATVSPLVGQSALLVRSEHSWHAVSPVVRDCSQSRLSMTVTFYEPGSISTLWPPGDETRLHTCEGTARWGGSRHVPRVWASLRPSIAARLRSR
jgi:SM-20-related protein